MPELVLDEMEMLDQKIAAARPVGQERLNFIKRLGVDLAALRGRRRPAAAAPSGWRMLARSNIHFGTFLDGRKRQSVI
jgi:hypothetical protein